MIRKAEGGDLGAWVANARGRLLSSFATGIAKDKTAIRAAITQP